MIGSSRAWAEVTRTKEIVPENLRWVVRFNPVRSILEVFRDPIYQGEIPPITHPWRLEPGHHQRCSGLGVL